MRTMLLLFVALGLNSAAAADVEALTSEEARAALRRARWPIRAPGFYRQVETTTGRAGVVARTTWEWISEDGVRRQRIERTTTGRKGAKTTRVTIVDEQGRWSLHERVAILHSLASVRPAMEAKLAGAKSELNGLDPEERGRLIESHASFTGERRRDERGIRLHITQVFGAKARELMRELAADAIADAKKQVPLLLRPIVAAAMVAKGGIEGQLPVRQETIVDESTGVIVSVRKFAADGRELTQCAAKSHWERCEPVPVEWFDVPPTLQRLEARSLGELIELERKHDDEDRALRAQRAHLASEKS